MSSSTTLFADLTKDEATLIAVGLAVAFAVFLVVLFVIVRRIVIRKLLKSREPKK